MDQGLCATGDRVALAYGWKSGVSSLSNFRMLIVGADISLAEPPAKPLTLPSRLDELLQTSEGYEPVPIIAQAAPFLARHDSPKMQALAQSASCQLDHCAKLDIYSTPAAQRQTGIICTIGPSVKKLSGDKAFSTTDFAKKRYGRVAQLVVAGVSVFYMFIFLVSELTSISNIFALLNDVGIYDDSTLDYTTPIAISVCD